MKIYTKTGDNGETSLFGGERIPKDALRIEAYGTVDELNSVLGIARSLQPHKSILKVLDSLQNDLFVVGADLATPVTTKNNYVPRIKKNNIHRLEKTIDTFQEHLKPLKTFILPGGSETASYLHLARTVCRRAERCTVRLSRNEDIGSFVIIYLNRLSDLLFVLARYANRIDNSDEIQWLGIKRKSK
jgi:cob(I)alamin adenosyltransferase